MKLRRLTVLLMLCTVLLPLCGCKTIDGGILPPKPLDSMAQDPPGRAGADALPEPPVVELIENKNDTFEPGVLTVNNSDYEIPQELQDALLNTMHSYPFGTAFYVLSLDTGMSIGYNAGNQYTPACTIKAGYALSCFKRIEAGLASLDDIYTFRYDRHWFWGSGTIQYMGDGAQLTVRDILHHLIDESDNTAYMMLWDIFAGLSAQQQYGDAYYAEMMESLGCMPWNQQFGKWSRMRPLDLGLVWQEIWRYYQTGSDEAKLYWEYLTTNQYCEIAKVVKDVSVIAHKSGWDTDGYHEAGIVCREHPYVVAVMTITGDENTCLHQTIKNLDNIMIDYNAWLDASLADKDA